MPLGGATGTWDYGHNLGDESREVRTGKRAFTNEEGLAAAVAYRESGRVLGIPHENIRRWEALAGTELLYRMPIAPSGREDGMERLDMDRLPDDPEELWYLGTVPFYQYW